MRIENSAPQVLAPSRLPGALAAMVDSAGGAGFPQALLGSMHALWGIRFAAVYDFAPRRPGTRFLFGASSDPHVQVQQNCGEYATRYAVDDPARRAVAAAAGSADIISTCLARHELPRPGHKRLIEEAGVLDRFACFFRADGGRWLGLHAMRDANCGPLTERDFAELRDYACVFRSLVCRHLSSAGAAEQTAEARVRRWLRESDAGLSEREADVCARLLCGESQAAIAGALGIRESSVQSYRKRAYVKLDVREMREIYLRILEK